MKNKKSSMKEKSATNRAVQSNIVGDRCGAYARSTGFPCKAKAMSNGRCKNHGGMSTGPKTPEGRKAIAEATRQRMATGQRQRVLVGFFAWLEGGGREMLSRLAKARERRKRWRRWMLD